VIKDAFAQIIAVIFGLLDHLPQEGWWGKLLISSFSLDEYEKFSNTYSVQKGKKRNNVAAEDHKTEIVSYLIVAKNFSETIVWIAYWERSSYCTETFHWKDYVFSTL